MNKLYFRAWHNEFKRFVQVDGIELPNTVYEIIPYGNGERNEYTIDDEVILMQGIEISDTIIYEGDKLLITDDEGGVDEAIVCQDRFGFYLCNSVGRRKDYAIEVIERQDVDFQVIGNIYEGVK